MAITEVCTEEVLKSSRETLGLPANADVLIDSAFLAASLRRTAGILCPCSRSTLSSAVLDSLKYLGQEVGELSEHIEATVEALTVVGDLLELSQVTIDDPSVKGTWVFAAPPGFVVRPGGSIFFTGMAPDESTPLPASLGSRVIHEGYARVIRPQISEDLPAALRDLGLLELSERVWLKAPKSEPAAEFIDRMLQQLATQSPSGLIDDLIILDPARSVDYYAGRWVSPKNESGSFIARRPQAYGANLWGYVALENGVATKFIDFPLKGSRWRGCDIAWHLQMAIDFERGEPQQYRRRLVSDGAYLDFFSPIPLWAQRRLVIIGRPAPREKCLFSYWLPEVEIAPEEEFLQKRLWLARREASP